MQQNIIEEYQTNLKKCDNKVFDYIKEALEIAVNLKLENMINQLTTNQYYITLKDHEENCYTNPKSRLINPTSFELERISKIIFEKRNKTIRNTKSFNQWTSTK